MNELMNLFGQPTGPQSFDSIRISIASPDSSRATARRFSIASRGTSGRPASSGIMAIAPSVVQPATIDKAVPDTR